MKDNKELNKRITSAIIFLPLILFLAYKGGIGLLIILDIAIVAAIVELKRAFNNIELDINAVLLILFSQIQFILIHNFEEHSNFLTILFLLIISGMIVIFSKKNISTTIIDVFTFCYVAISLSMLYQMRKNYEYFFWSVFIISMGTDTMAYFCGKIFGKHKLIPDLSPNKTIEGSIGAIIFTIIFMILYNNVGLFHKYNIIFVIVYAILGSVASQLGDLFASSIKRMTKIKDFGKIIPGHGGIMDRADSIIFTGIYVYAIVLFLKLFQNDGVII